MGICASTPAASLDRREDLKQYPDRLKSISPNDRIVRKLFPYIASSSNTFDAFDDDDGDDGQAFIRRTPSRSASTEDLLPPGPASMGQNSQPAAAPAVKVITIARDGTVGSLNIDSDGSVGDISIIDVIYTAADEDENIDDERVVYDYPIKLPDVEQVVQLMKAVNLFKNEVLYGIPLKSLRSISFIEEDRTLIDNYCICLLHRGSVDVTNVPDTADVTQQTQPNSPQQIRAYSRHASFVIVPKSRYDKKQQEQLKNGQLLLISSVCTADCKYQYRVISGSNTVMHMIPWKTYSAYIKLCGRRNTVLKCPIMADLTVSEYEDLAPHVQIVSYPRGAIITKEGGQAEKWWIILSGITKIEKSADGDGERNESYDPIAHKAGPWLGAPQFFGEEALLTDTVSKYTVTCDDARVLVIEISRYGFNNCMHRVRDYLHQTYHMARIRATKEDPQAFPKTNATSPTEVPDILVFLSPYICGGKSVPVEKRGNPSLGDSLH
jgi:Cyclic nucleotide-binding domain